MSDPVLALFFTAEVVAVRMLEGRAADGQIVFARAAMQLAVVSIWIKPRRRMLLGALLIVISALAVTRGEARPPCAA